MSLLYGHDDTERIVGIVTHDDESVMIYKRLKDGSVRSYIESSWSYFYTTAEGAEEAQKHHAPEWGRDNHTVVELETYEKGFYTHLICSRSRKNSADLAKAVREEDIPVWRVGSAATQYLMQTGRTLFKGMTLNDVRRMQIDIETISFDGKFPSADRPEDEIVIVSVSDNHGFERVLHTSRKCEGGLPDERLLLVELMRTILMRDPDIIEGHNFFRFDLPYILTRAKYREVEFTIGRNNRIPHGYASSKKFAERDIEYINNVIPGRHIIDTLFLVSDYDVYKRDMPSYGLKAAAKYFDLAREGRVYVEGDEIAKTWVEDPAKLIEYALDDVRETQALSTKLLPATFELTKMVPSTLHQIHVGGIATAIEQLFAREYLYQQTAIPKPEYGKQAFGGMTGVALRGLIKDLLYIDVASLYPSIMLNYAIRPASDHLDVFQQILRMLTDLRLKTKAEMGEHEEGSELHVMLDAQQNAYKKIINSFYGALGYQRFAWNCLAEADRVATTGQSILVHMMKIITKYGAQIVEVDTDGILCTRPEGVTNALQFVKEVIEPFMPQGIKLDLDGEYAVMLSYQSKNYAMKDKKGKIKVKGGAFKSRSIEKFARVWMQSAIKYMLDEDWKALRESFIELRQKVYNREIPVSDLSVRQNLKIPLPDYEMKGEKNKQAQYEIWKKYPTRFDVGDPVVYYIATHKRRKKDVISYLDAALIDEYKPGSENVRHYLDRLVQVASKFDVFFSPEDFAFLFDGKPDVGQQSFFAQPEPDYSRIQCPVEQVATVDDFDRQLNLNLAKYERLYRHENTDDDDLPF